MIPLPKISVLSLALSFIVGCDSTISQAPATSEIEISGHIIASGGVPLRGVVVQLRHHSEIRDTTDENGAYTLQVADSGCIDTIDIHYSGMPLYSLPFSGITTKVSDLQIIQREISGTISISGSSPASVQARVLRRTGDSGTVDLDWNNDTKRYSGFFWAIYGQDLDSIILWVNALDPQRRITGESGKIVVSSKSGNVQVTEFPADNLVPRISMTSSSEIHRLDTIRVHAEVSNISAKSLSYEWSVGDNGWSPGASDFSYMVPEKQAEALTIRVRAIRTDGVSSTESKSVSVISYPVDAMMKVSTDSVAFGDTIRLHFDEVDSPGSAITRRSISGFADALKNISVSGNDTVIRVSSWAAVDASVTYCVENDWKASDCSTVKLDVKSFPKLSAKSEGTHVTVTWPNTLKDTITDICINGNCGVSRGDTSFTFQRLLSGPGLMQITMNSKIHGSSFKSVVDVDVPSYSNDFEVAGDASGFPIVTYDSIFKSKAGKIALKKWEYCYDGYISDYIFWRMGAANLDGFKSLTFRIRSSVAQTFELGIWTGGRSHGPFLSEFRRINSSPEGSLFTLNDSDLTVEYGHPITHIGFVDVCLHGGNFWGLQHEIPENQFIVIDDIKINY